MANSNSTTIIPYLVLMVAILAFSLAESRLFATGIGKPPIASTPVCFTAYGVQTGDTCFGVTQFFNLTTDLFASINPNLNCTALFVSQWLCVNGTASI